jgi:uncharacterized damage-inducible protein DinB
MNGSDLLITEFEIIQRQLPATLEGLSSDQLHWRPARGANSIGFLLWHVLRTWDGYLAIIRNTEEIYARDAWAEKFGFDTSGRGIEGSGMGTGFTPDDVDFVLAQTEPLLGYLQSLLEETLDDLRSATADDLSREVLIPWWPSPAAAARVYVHIIAHSYFHLGEAQYIRGMQLS